ncbi:MAG: PmoA family protein [Planctomycetia bacterium]|nr:PmoA family protein [Planctomycetia bacterium]
MPYVRSAILGCCLSLFSVLTPDEASAQGTVTVAARDKAVHGVAVLIDGKLFADYVIGNGPKPYIWPIVGPTGKPMTRAYANAWVDGETTDHPHQRSFWFTHGNVNGVNFWAENPGDGSKLKEADGDGVLYSGHGSIEHKEFTKIEAAGSTATLVSRNDWLGPKGDKILEDERTTVFRDLGDARAIDFTIVLKATNGDVKFGETKEGSFGVRVPTEMDVDHKPTGGKIVSSEGLTNKDAWGTKAAWVDYSGTVGGEQLGVAIFNHPLSFRFPTRWHVRPYGLFAANPFGATSFDKNTKDESGATVRSGESLTLRYRVFFHKGDVAVGGIDAAYKQYAAEKP